MYDTEEVKLEGKLSITTYTSSSNIDMYMIPRNQSNLDSIHSDYYLLNN